MFTQIVGQYYRHPMMERDDIGVHPIAMLACLAVLVLIVMGIYSLAKGHGHGTPDKKPLDIAKERYAKGEITKDEFEQIKKDL